MTSSISWLKSNRISLESTKLDLGKYENPPNGILKLWDRVQEKWNSIDKEGCLKLIISMTNRIEQAFKANGGYTKY